MVSPIDNKPFSSAEASKEVSTRVKIPPNFKSLPLDLQENILDNLKVRELEALKVSLGKGFPKLVEKINAHISDLKAFQLLLNERQKILEEARKTHEKIKNTLKNYGIPN